MEYIILYAYGTNRNKIWALSTSDDKICVWDVSVKVLSNLKCMQ